jgi:kinesin family protein 3/17
MISKLNSKEQPKPFTFDGVYPPDASQRQLYDETAFPLVESVLEGYNGTIFAYGQTGCGKTYTMVGEKSNPENCGVIPNAFSHIFGFIDSNAQENIKYLVRCSYIEIYLESIMDLLSKNEQTLELKEDPQKGTFVKDITTVKVKSTGDIEKLMNEG